MHYIGPFILVVLITLSIVFNSVAIAWGAVAWLGLGLWAMIYLDKKGF